MRWIAIAYIAYVITFLTGLIFFVRFDARRRPLRKRLLGLHLVMAVTTFILITSIMSVNAFPNQETPPPKNPTSSTMWDYVHQHRSELAHEKSSHGQLLWQRNP